MKKIAVIANQKDYSEYIAQNLEPFFSKYAEFCCYETTEIEGMAQIEEDYVILSAFTIFQAVKRKAKGTTRIIIVDRTLNRHTIEQLHRIPQNARALLVNIDYKNCMEVITMIYNIGFKSLELIPYYPGCDYDESIKLAITPGEVDLVPRGVSTVIDLKQRPIDMNSILNIAEAVGVEDPIGNNAARQIVDSMVNFNTEMSRLLEENSSMSVQLHALLKLVKQGIIITDNGGKIYLVNDTAREMLKNRTELLRGFNVVEIFPEFESGKVDLLQEQSVETLIEINGKEVIATLSRVEDSRLEDSGGLKGTVIMLEYFNEVEDRQHKLRSKITGYGHKASYTFDKILGNSSQIEETKRIAMRMARSDSSICLYGESGTGKELFAQSIHNYSSRRDKLFVAINCSALPENLLESEMYGYEEGAFSGARKGGKIGLFELAHKGSLFLDEIGELPMQMQAKLLRAIEEQKILKIGGRNLIDIDVRIICATNRNLQKMVEEGQFRRDLYYRLCVLPIYIPPLREREGDVLLLMERMKQDIGASYSLTEEAKRRIIEYPWPGNVRELKNITEYLANLGKDIIEGAEIPFFYQGNRHHQVDSGPTRLATDQGFVKCGTVFDERPVSRAVEHRELYRFILSEIHESQRQRRHIGRQALADRAKQEGLFITEQEIRSGLRRLAEEGCIISYKGRKGSVITEKGRKMLDTL